MKIAGETTDLPASELTGVRLGGKVKVKERVAVHLEKARAAEGKLISLDVADDDVLEIELEDGVKLWTTLRDFRRDFGTPTVRSAGSEYVIFPTEIDLRGPSRGGLGWAIKVLRVFDVDVSGMAAGKLAEVWEKKTIPHPGLYRCKSAASPDLIPVTRISPMNEKEAVLLFLHGTASSFTGSFSGLWQPESGKVSDALLGMYQDRIYAFEHHTLSQTPIENAIDLLRKLPDHANLHLVSHSRGGLIGELLCRAGVPANRDPFDEKDVAIFMRQDDDDEAHVDRTRDRDALTELNTLLKKKRPQVSRFVRVACPARGTTLASERLDRWLSIIINVLNFAGLQQIPLFDAATDLIAAIVKERTDPRTLPGLEAMMPTAPLIKLVNRPDVTVDADLSVIAGDIEAGGIWEKLKLLAVDRFYEGDHDLVVNTASMSGGATRAKTARWFFDQGSQVDHFHYFYNARTAERVRDGLLRTDDSLAGFEPLSKKPEKPIPRDLRGKEAARGPKPVVFVLPGIMGSHLALNGDRLWIDLTDLMGGALAALHFEARTVLPDGPVEGAYEAILEYLDTSHEVIPFAFDWRLSLRHAARQLAQAVKTKLDEAERVHQPVRFLAHSMGGLVVRTLIADYPDVWARVCQHPGSRFLMLGTPNSGSFVIPKVLVGQERLVYNLALLDFTNNAKGLLKIIAKFPGLLEMLPTTGSRFNFFAMATWEQFASVDDKGWVLPEEKQLRAAQETRALLDRSPIDSQRMLYVAGSAPVTPVDLEVDAGADKGERFRFLATPRGDGRVPWDTGIPAELLPEHVWYIDCEHGDLANQESAFPALLDLLQTGQTVRLSRTAPAVIRGAERLVLPRDVADVYPAEEDVQAAAIGTHRRRRRREKHKQRVRVCVVHGHLGFTSNIVAVGHYYGDTIVSAEAVLDRLLDGRLREYVRLGLYPGPLGSAEVFLNPGRKPQGAMVIGLGRVGELTLGHLTVGFARGALVYATMLAEREKQAHQGQLLEPVQAKISSLLIGTGAGGLTIEDSMAALLQGVAQANRTLAERGLANIVTITELEFIELFEDRAITAAHVLPRLIRDPLLQGEFANEPGLTELDGGMRRVNFDEAPGWYHRLQITAQPDDSLRFNALTARARAEVTLQPTQRTLVDQFIARAIKNPTHDPQTTATLFELLLPNPLKEQVSDRSSVVLVVNEEAARYPWELLQDRRDSEGVPRAVRAGLIRQLESQEFRANPVAAVQLKALVIGDPISQFVELPGAQAEAENVSTVLIRQGFTVTKRIREHAQEIVTAMFADDYRILHLAGHGVYAYPLETGEGEQSAVRPGQTLRPSRDKHRVTGMVLGTNVFLTPTEVRQMRHVPELVFINCCHLGKIEGGKDSDWPARHKLAANLATEFICMGVRAVVAAGWAVDDAAATTFAREFYTSLLDGRPFGEAVLQARKATFDQHRTVNTWGAYQCYGDPDWRLQSEGRQPVPSVAQRYEFIAPVEAIVELENLANRAKMAENNTVEALRKGLRELAGVLTPEWLSSAPLRCALGQAYGELDLFPEAITHYQHAIWAERGAASLSAIEQLVNLQCRYAVELANKGDMQPPRSRPRRSAEPETLIRQAIAHLQRLCELGNALDAETRAPDQLPFGESVERLCLLGSSYKRLAIVTTGNKRKSALREMADSYRHAHVRAVQQQKPKPYPLLNLIAANYALQTLFPQTERRVARKPKGREDDKKLLTIVDGLVKEKLTPDTDFWDAIASADYQLTRHLIEQTLAENINSIVQGYREAKKRGGSPREFRSVLEHIDFLIEMWRGDTKTPAGKKRFSALQDIREKLTVEPQTS
jgi:CHAT domain-containing protein/pimeloyl-ACP methyl ester carboxylesterase